MAAGEAGRGEAGSLRESRELICRVLWLYTV